MTRCAQCGADIPAGGQFCIECGAPAGAAPAATGPTERLPEYSGGAVCASCGTRNPAGADFCVMCGRALAARPVAEPPPNPLPLPPVAAPLAPRLAGGIEPTSTNQPRARSFVNWDGITGGVWLIGLAVLFMTGWWWPGIMVLIGLSALFSGLAHAQDDAARAGAIQGAAWMIGLAVIAAFNWWWPGILVLLGISALLGGALRGHH